MKQKLPATVVGLDVETTSLDPLTGEIIEIAAIRFNVESGKEIARFVRLAHPRAPLSPEVTAITGITEQEVAGKPPFAAFREEVKAFIGSDTIIAHNAAFDLGYLAQHGVVIKNPIWDTFKLATVAWPEVPSYNLGTLARELRLEVTGEHRAAEDVLVTWQLLQLIKKQLAVSQKTGERISGVLDKAGLSNYTALFTLARKQQGSAAGKQPYNDRRLEKQEYEDIEKIFSSSGPLATAIPNFSGRSEQVRMATAIKEVFHKGGIGLIEAGTGTGKTYAYLIPLLQMVKGGQPVVISTYTKHLQDQLVLKDIPHILNALKVSSYRVATLKGRRNYVCRDRLERILKRISYKEEEAWLLIKIIVWLDSGGDGDLERLNISHQPISLLRQIHADAIACRLVCAKKPENKCPYQEIRRKASAADVLVVNHALLVQISRDSAFPLDYLVIDEAHHLEEAARKATEIDISEYRLEEVIKSLLQQVHNMPERQLTRVKAEIEELRESYAKIIKAAGNFTATHTKSGRIRLTPGIRRSADWQKLLQRGKEWHARLAFFVGLIRSNKVSHPRPQALTEEIQAVEEFGLQLEKFLSGQNDRIQWIAVHESGYQKRPNSTLNDVALSVQEDLNILFTKSRSVILTSATMTTGGNFSYMKRRLGIDKAYEMQLGSSFKYRDQMLIYIVEEAIEPNNIQYDAYTATIIQELAVQLRGRILGLFTSHQSIKKVYQMLIRYVYKAKIRLLAQKVTGGRYNIIKRFKEQQESVLLGTASLWEGIDIPGESLSCVVIARLPFPAPDDPIFEAVAEAEGVNMFEQLSVPTMILRLKQGIGRLIRTSTDKGIAVIIDGRLLRQMYGDDVLKSLPPATVHIGGRDELLSHTRAWFGEETLKRWQEERE